MSAWRGSPTDGTDATLAERRGLKLNGEKTRLVNLTEEGIDFLGFGMTWRKGKSAKSYPHVEPNAKSQAKLRKKLGQLLNHWPLHESVQETVQKVNRVVTEWINYFHYANRSAVFTQRQHHTRKRLRRWLWRKHGCRKGLFQHYTNERLENHIRGVVFQRRKHHADRSSEDHALPASPSCRLYEPERRRLPGRRRFICEPRPLKDVRKHLDLLAAHLHDAEADQLKLMLKDAVPEYQPYLT